MPNNQIVIAYSATATNVTPARLAAAMAAVVLYSSPTQDSFICQMLGLTIALPGGDVTTIAGSVVTRTITLNMDFTAGAPVAPQGFQIHNQTVDPPVGAAIFSSSIEDSPTVQEPVTECPPGCPAVPAFTTRPGIGAYTVDITYTDAEGNIGTSSVTLQGQQPVVIPLAPGTHGVAAIVVPNGMAVTSSGSLNNNVGQLTIKVINTPPCDCPPTPPTTEPALQDFDQDQLGDAIAYMPPSFYSYAMQTNPTAVTLPAVPPCPPCPAPSIPAPPLPTPTLLIAMLTGIFTSTLAQALQTGANTPTGILAAAPALI